MPWKYLCRIRVLNSKIKGQSLKFNIFGLWDASFIKILLDIAAMLYLSNISLTRMIAADFGTRRFSSSSSAIEFIFTVSWFVESIELEVILQKSNSPINSSYQ